MKKLEQDLDKHNALFNDQLLNKLEVISKDQENKMYKKKMEENREKAERNDHLREVLYEQKRMMETMMEENRRERRDAEERHQRELDRQRNPTPQPRSMGSGRGGCIRLPVGYPGGGWNNPLKDIFFP